MKNNSSDGKKSGGVSRRTFIKSVGLSSVGVAAIDVGNLSASGLLKDKKILGPDKIQISLNVNGRELPALIEPRTTLVEVLRDQFHLTGTKIGCNRGACGACTVILGNKDAGRGNTRWQKRVMHLAAPRLYRTGQQVQHASVTFP